MTSPKFTLRLPLPPSLNQAYRGTGIKGNYGLMRTQQYKDWLTNAGFFFRQQFPLGIPAADMIGGRIFMQYIVYQCDNIRRDVDNYSKIVSDWLQGKFFANDEQIDEIHITKRIDLSINRNLLYVFITEIEDRRRVDMLNPA